MFELSENSNRTKRKPNEPMPIGTKRVENLANHDPSPGDPDPTGRHQSPPFTWSEAISNSTPNISSSLSNIHQKTQKNLKNEKTPEKKNQLIYYSIKHLLPQELIRPQNPLYTTSPFQLKWSVSHDGANIQEIRETLDAILAAKQPSWHWRIDDIETESLDALIQSTISIFNYQSTTILEISIDEELDPAQAALFYHHLFETPITTSQGHQLKFHSLDKDSTKMNVYCLITPRKHRSRLRSIIALYFKTVDEKTLILDVIPVDLNLSLDIDIFLVQASHNGDKLPPKTFKTLEGYPKDLNLNIARLRDTEMHPLTTNTYCVYCRKTSHTRAQCPEAPNCHYCQQTSHMFKNCPLLSKDKRQI